MFFKEDFLHFVWLNSLYDHSKLRAVTGEKVEVVFPGYPNNRSGPDFTEAKVIIDGQLWAGNVEIHLKSSDWFAHHHETDPSYDSVVLHVVYRFDMPVYNTHGAPIPAVELHNNIDPEVFYKYRQLQSAKHPLKCSEDLPVEEMFWTKWKERLFINRLESKVAYFEQLLSESVRDWEAVMFLSLLRYFGMLHNTDAFEDIGRKIGFQTFRKYLDKPLYLEALLLGVAGFLDSEEATDAYVEELAGTFRFLSSKHGLQRTDIPVTHGRIRPANFPSIRLSQFAHLYHLHPGLFEKLVHSEKINILADTLRVAATSYWESHYYPGKASKPRKKLLGKSFINALIMNVIIPLRFAYARHYGNEKLMNDSVQLAAELPAENNRIVRIFTSHRLPVRNAADSQAVLELYRHYCSQNNCINCAVGKKILTDANHR